MKNWAVMFVSNVSCQFSYSLLRRCSETDSAEKSSPPLILLTESPKRALFAFWQLPGSYLRAAYALSLSKMTPQHPLNSKQKCFTASAVSRLSIVSRVHLSNHHCCGALPPSLVMVSAFVPQVVMLQVVVVRVMVLYIIVQQNVWAGMLEPN